MPNVTTAAAYQQILSMAVEDRSSGYEDLVSNNNALLAVLQTQGPVADLFGAAHSPDPAGR